MILGPTEIRPVAATAKAAGVSMPAALAGKVIEARLMMALGDGVFRFTSAENEFDLPLPKNLPPGTQVRVTPQPDGSYQVTVLEEGALPPSRPGAPALPPLNLVVRPQTPLPNLPAGQPVDARVVSNPQTGTVRVATPQGEVDLPLPRSLPVGTTVRLTPQAGGAINVSVPSSSPATAAPQVQQPVVHPSVFTVKPEGQAPQLPAGQVVEARVISNTPGNVARFTSPEGEFDLPLPKAFPPGSQARIVAQPGGNFVVTMRPVMAEPPISLPGTVSPSSTVAPPATPGATSLQSSLPPPISLKPGPLMPAFPENQIVNARVASAPVNGVVRFTAPSGDFDLPMTQQLPLGMPVRVLPQPNGGLTLLPLNDVQAQAVQKPPGVVTTSPAEAVRQTAVASIGKQDGFARLFANIEDLPYRLDVPVPVKRAADALLQQRLPLESIANPRDLAKAIASSGLFAERTLASLPQMQAAPPDMKLALFVLRAALGSWGSVRTDAPLRADSHLPPPGSGMPPAAQQPAEPMHPRGSPQMQNISPDELVPRLVADTDAAVARINLHQISSLSDDKAAAAARGDAPDTRWSCEVPLNVDGRTAMFGFVVERDARHAQQDKAKRKWRVRAALDLPDTGAVEADVRLRGDVVSASIITERSEMAALLEASLQVLRDGLTAAGFEVESLHVRVGKGAPEARPQRHFVDRKT